MENKIKEYIDNYLKNFKSAETNEWNHEDAYVLLGAIQMYEARGEDFYKDFVIKYFDKYITEDINFGRTLFFLYEATGDNKYKKAVDILYHQLRTYPNQIGLDELFMTQPFYMQYETKLAKKENYSDIVRQFKNVKNISLSSMGWYLLGLMDSMEEMDEMIFEYYKELEILFKEAVRGFLADVEGNSLDAWASAMVVAAILKACRMRVLLPHKYQSIGEEIFYAIAGQNIVSDDHKGAGALMMAYGQLLLLKKKQGGEV